jgi:hypothetical protein
MFPTISLVAQDATATWFEIGLLGVSSIILFYFRKKLRTALLLPLIYVPLTAAVHFRLAYGTSSPPFIASILVLMVASGAAMVTDAFWRARSDDLADLNYMSNFRD